MAATAQEIQVKLEAELSALNDEPALRVIRELLVAPPRAERRFDEYTSSWRDCWIVLDDPHFGTGIAYCGDGSEFSPWGLVWTDKTSRCSLGPDSSWFPSFAQAFDDSFSRERCAPGWRANT